MRIFFKSTHLVHPCTPRHSGTPLENSGTPWSVRYTRLTSTDLDPVVIVYAWVLITESRSVLAETTSG